MSSLQVNTLYASTANNVTVFKDINGTEIGQLCKAWVNFNGANGTIRSQFNVSSVTDGGTGTYTINFINALPNANYVPVSGVMSDTSSWGGIFRSSGSGSTSAPVLKTTTQFTVYLVSNNPTLPAATDADDVNIAFFG